MVVVVVVVYVSVCRGVNSVCSVRDVVVQGGVVGGVVVVVVVGGGSGVVVVEKPVLGRHLSIITSNKKERGFSEHGCIYETLTNSHPTPKYSFVNDVLPLTLRVWIVSYINGTLLIRKKT